MENLKSIKYKILFPYLGHWQGANYSRFHRMLNMLSKRGHDIYVIDTPLSNIGETSSITIEDLPEINNIKITTVAVNKFFTTKKFPLDKIFKKLIYSLKQTSEIKRTLLEKKMNILYLYNIPHLPLISFANKHRIKIILDIVDDYPDMIRKEIPLLGNIAYRMAINMLRYMIKHSTINLCSSQDLMQRYKLNCIYLPNSVNIQKFSEYSNKGYYLRKEYPESKKIAGYVGSIEDYVNIDLILKAAKKVEENWNFVFIGSGRKFDYLKKSIKELEIKNVFLKGPISYKIVPLYIDSFDVCLNIFKHEDLRESACPLKIFEYAALKKPIISTPLRETKNIAGDNIFYADSVDELKEVLDYLSSKSEEVIIKTNNMFDLVNSKYSLEKIVDQLEKLF